MKKTFCDSCGEETDDFKTMSAMDETVRLHICVYCIEDMEK